MTRSRSFRRQALACAALLAALPLVVAAAPATQQITAVTYIDVIPDQFVAGNEEQAQALLHTMIADTRKEPGLVSFTVLQETVHGNHFTLLEVWKDAKALDAHAQAEHTRKFRVDLQSHIGSPYLTLVTTPMK